MNISFWDVEVARAFRVRQVDEQGGFPSVGMDGRAAITRLMEVARENSRRRMAGEDLDGFACAIDPAGWAT
jgi:hypothetical protein